MNVYVIEDEILILAVEMLDARKHLAEVKKDKVFLNPKKVELRKLKKRELSEVLLMGEAINDVRPLLDRMEEKIDLDPEVYEDYNWDYKIK